MKNLYLFLIATALILTGCGSTSMVAPKPDRSLGISDVANTSGNTTARLMPQESGGGGGNGSNDPAPNITEDQARNSEKTPTERKIVRNAELSLESASPEETQQKIAAAVESAGGCVVESQQRSSERNSSTRDIVSMTLRVPAEKFADVVGEIRKTADRVIVETVKGQDVTEEFVDIEARLAAKKALEQQFIEIMKRANSVEDALNVQRQLAEVRGEIEQIEGRKHFLENQASLSTIKVEIRTPAAFSAYSAGFSNRLTEALSAGVDFALNFILGLVAFVIGILPFLIFIVLPLFLIARYFWKRHRRQKMADEIVQEELANE
jgi:hypothetical protein